MKILNLVPEVEIKIKDTDIEFIYEDPKKIICRTCIRDANFYRITKMLYGKVKALNPTDIEVSVGLGEVCISLREKEGFVQKIIINDFEYSSKTGECDYALKAEEVINNIKYKYYKPTYVS